MRILFLNIITPLVFFSSLLCAMDGPNIASTGQNLFRPGMEVLQQLYGDVFGYSNVLCLKSLDNTSFKLTNVPLRALQVIQSPDGTLWLNGEKRWGEPLVAFIKDAKISAALDYGFKKIIKMAVSPDGTVYIFGERKIEGYQYNVDPNKFVAIKDNQVSELPDYGIKIKSFAISPQGDLYLAAEEQKQKIIRRLKDGKTWNFGTDLYVSHLDFASGDLYVRVYYYGTSKAELYCINNGGMLNKIPELSNFDIHKFVVSPWGVVYVAVYEKYSANDINDWTVVEIKNRKITNTLKLRARGSICEIQCFKDFTRVETYFEEQSDHWYPEDCDMRGEQETLEFIIQGDKIEPSPVSKYKGRLVIEGANNNIFDRILECGHEAFIGDQVVIKSLQELCENLLSCNAYLDEKSALQICNFFLPYVGKIVSNREASFEMHNFLTKITSTEESNGYGYMLALYLTLSGLETKAFVYNNGTSKDELLRQKKTVVYLDRLQATKELRDLLQAIIKNTTNEFAANYVNLLILVNAALNVLEA